MPNCMHSEEERQDEFRYNEHGVYSEQSEDEEAQAF